MQGSGASSTTGGGASAEVRTAGWGGLAVVAGITGLARSTINRGADDLGAEPLAKGQVRRADGGRKAVSETDLELVPELKRLVEPATLSDPSWRSQAPLGRGPCGIARQSG